VIIFSAAFVKEIACPEQAKRSQVQSLTDKRIFKRSKHLDLVTVPSKDRTPHQGYRPWNVAAPPQRFKPQQHSQKQLYLLGFR
jgi:hypothetical protein